MNSITENQIGNMVVDAAIQVHRTLGPGLLESAYEVCLTHELRSRGASIQTQAELPITYKNVRLDAGYRLNILIENKVIIELKAAKNCKNHIAFRWSRNTIRCIPFG